MKVAADDITGVVIPECGRFPVEEAPRELPAALRPFIAPNRTGAVPPPRASALEHAAVCGEAPGTPQLQKAVSVADMTAFALFSASPKVPGSAVTARPTARPSSVAPPRVS